MSEVLSHFSRVSLCVLLLGTAACSNVTKHSNDNPQIVAAPDTVSAMLATAADRASNALQTLAAIESSRTPATNTGPVGNAPVELRRPVTVNCIGTVEPITESLAERSRYYFLTICTPPPLPVVLS